jgi:hypothetical protein
MGKSSVELEKLVQRIQQQLAPQADVSHNVHLEGRRTGTKRQIDVLVTEKIGQYEISIIIDCKDHRRPIGLVTVLFRVLEWRFIQQGERIWHTDTATNFVGKRYALH